MGFGRIGDTCLGLYALEIYMLIAFNFKKPKGGLDHDNKIRVEEFQGI